MSYTSNIKVGDLVSFIKGQSDEVEGILFPGNKGSLYLVVSDPKMKVFTGQKKYSSHETLSVDIMLGTNVATVPVNLLQRTEKLVRKYDEP